MHLSINSPSLGSLLDQKTLSEELKEFCIRVKSPKPLEVKEINMLYERVMNATEIEREMANCNLDKSHDILSVITRLYNAVNHGEFVFMNEWESSNGAQKVIDPTSKKTLFCAKRPELQERFGVPRYQAVAREHLYYLLDRDFAGVPPLFRISKNGWSYSFSWFKEDLKGWFDFEHKKNENKISLRKCIIHQFRTVNKDPSPSNVLVDTQNHVVVPIDGSYSLPKRLCKKRASEILCSSPFCIGDLKKPISPQSYLNDPFTSEEIDYIKSINIEEDETLIAKHIEGNYTRKPIKGAEHIKNVVRIFRVANLILKEAINRQINISTSTLITLHDLCCLREVEFSQLVQSPKHNLFMYILEGQDSDSINNRIHQVFDGIIKIKEYIQKNGELEKKVLKENVLREISEIGFKNHERALEALACTYMKC